jgi:hypothetical protein
MNRTVGCVGVVLLAAVFIGCSGSSTTDKGVGEAGQAQSNECASLDPKAQPFSYDMKATSTDGSATVLVDSDPPQPAPNDYATWTLKITDASNAPLTGKTVTIKGIMHHGALSHGLGKTVTVTEEPSTPGTYKATPVDFNMGGPWDVQIQIGDSADAGSANSAPVTVTYDLCI